MEFEVANGQVEIELYIFLKAVKQKTRRDKVCATNDDVPVS